MKRTLIIIKYAILNAIPYAIGYGLGEFIGDLLQLNAVVTCIFALFLLILAGTIGEKALHWYEKKYRKLDIKLFFTAILTYFIFDYLTDYVFGKSLFANLLGNLAYELIVGLSAFAFSRLILAIKRKRIIKAFQTGDLILTHAPAATQPNADSSIPINAKIEGQYDITCAVTCKTGTFVGEKHKGILIFRGIPYAQPPVGPLRWKAPLPLSPSHDVFQAVHFSPIPPQPAFGFAELNAFPKSEDCLTLNIWTAAEAKTRKRPVLLFIHGGDLNYSASAFSIFDGLPFVKQHPDTIFVSLNYRLGLLGILDLSNVPGGQDYPDSTELPLLDQIAALNWLKDNIAAFHGDPENITLCGNDAGGLCAAILAAAPQANTLFRRLILLSTPGTFFCAPEMAQEQTAKLMEHLQVTTMNELTHVPWERLCQAQTELKMNFFGFIRGRGIVPKNLLDAYANGAAKGIELLVCTAENSINYYIIEQGTKYTRQFFHLLGNEMKNILPESKRELFDMYYDWGRVSHPDLPEAFFFDHFIYHSFGLALCHAHASAGLAARCLRWKIPSPIHELGAFCNIELPFILNTLQSAENLAIIGDPRIGLVIQAAIAQFLKNGNPELPMDTIHHNDFLKWPPITTKKTPVLVAEDDKLTLDWKIIAQYAYPVEQLLRESPELPERLVQITKRMQNELRKTDDNSNQPVLSTHEKQHAPNP